MFPAPNYTQTPNVFFDDIAKTLKEGELRVLLVIMRQTFGWRKEWDRISITQMELKTGLKRKCVIASVKSLIEKGIIKKVKKGEAGDEKCYYSLVTEIPEKDEELDDNIDVDLEDSNNFTQCPLDPPPSVLRIPTKETITKEKKIVCPDPRVGVPEPQKIVKKIATDGKEESLKLDDVYRMAIQSRKDWRSSEIAQAWQILCDYEGRVNDLWRFIEGTIENIRSKVRLEKLKNTPKEEKKCQPTVIRAGRTPTKEEIDMLMRPSPERDSLMKTLKECRIG